MVPGIIECLIALGVIGITCIFAGRLAAIILTVVCVAITALVMPPLLSLRVERSADLAVLLFQVLVGFVVATRLPTLARSDRQTVVPPKSETTSRLTQRTCSLPTIVHRAMGRDADLARRLGDIAVSGDLDAIAVSERELERVVADVLRIAFSHSNVQWVSTYTGRQPALDRITVEAEYDLKAATPRISLLGRSDNLCRLRIEHWPPNCSATWFDNGYAYIYQISIYKRDSS